MLIRLLASVILTASGGHPTSAAETIRSPPSPPSSPCGALREAHRLVPVPLPSEVIDAPECTPLAVYLLWRLERSIGRRADAPSRDPGHPGHRFFRYVQDHAEAFVYEESLGFFVPTELRLEQAGDMSVAAGELVAEMAYARIAALDRAAWEDGDGRAVAPRILRRYRAFVEEHPESRLVRLARERAEALTGGPPGPPGSDVIGEDDLLPGQTPLAELGGMPRSSASTTLWAATSSTTSPRGPSRGWMPGSRASTTPAEGRLPGLEETPTCCGARKAIGSRGGSGSTPYRATFLRTTSTGSISTGTTPPI